MKLEHTERLLKRFDYSYQRNNQLLVIKMDFSQRVAIDFSNTEKIVITDQLTGWNFLTGIFNMSIKNAILFNVIGGIVLSLIVAFYNLTLGIILFFGGMIWVSLWSTYYLSKSENLKHILINWND